MDTLMFKTISSASKLTYEAYEIDFNMIHACEFLQMSHNNE